MHVLTATTALALLATAAWSNDATARPARPPADSNASVALFERSEPSLGTLALETTGQPMVFSLVAGGIPAGAASAADCAVRIEGSQDIDGIVHGHVVPSRHADNDITAADIGPNPPKVDIAIGPEGAFITDHGAAARFCGMGSLLDGFYKRLDTPE